jgi:2'-5' RNA ligase
VADAAHQDPAALGADAYGDTMAIPVVRDRRAVDDGTVTLGVAVAVPPPHAQVLQGWRADFGDPEAARIPAHVTLLPPTSVRRQDLPAIREHLHAAASRHSPFTMVLRGTGSFRPVSDVVFVQVAEGIAECEQIEREVRSGLLARDLAFYYHPHVTVAHDVPHDALDRASQVLADYEAVFQVASISGYLHEGDGVWRVDEVYPLLPGAARGAGGSEGRVRA